MMENFVEVRAVVVLTAFLATGAVLARPPAVHASAALPGATDPGRLDALGPDGEALGPCPLEHTDVHAEIAGFVTRVRVKQTFSNPFDDPIEAVYTFPLSSDGAVDAMTIRAGERVIRGEVKLREEAREIYEAAKQGGHLAALLDEERANVFTQRVANLMPGESVEVEIQYVESLDYADGRFEFSFPMVVGPRFVPGVPVGHAGTGWSPDTERVPDASSITPPVAPPGVRAGHDVSLSVELAAGLPVVGLHSALHTIDVDRVDETHRRIRLRNQREIPNRDFVLRWIVAAEELESGVLVHRPDPGADGYVSFLLVPPERVAADEVAPREVVFVVDRSGSQSGKPLAHAKATILYAIDHLNPGDTFQVVSFSNAVEKLFPRPRVATKAAKREARAYVEGLRANGGTMMAEAVREVCSRPAPDNRLRIVSFMTDGYVGNDHEVIDLVRRLRGESRWFPFGTGNSTNRLLLDHIAREGGGEVEYVLLSDDPAESARRFHERIAAPVLTDVRIEFEGLDVKDPAPHRTPDLWAHRPLIVHARYGESGEGRVVLRGFRQGRPWKRALEVELPERAPANAPIASMWARARVNELLGRDLRGLQQGSFLEELRQVVESIALGHSLLTPFTSFVAVEERVVNEKGEVRTVTVPVEVPDGVDSSAIFGHTGGGPIVARSLPMAAMKRPSFRSAADPTAEGGPPARTAVLSEEEPETLPADSGPAVLSGDDAGKLGALLRALLEEGPEEKEELSVRVELEFGVSPDVERRLAAAGLEIGLVLDSALVGRIAVEDLEALLSLDEVRLVILP